VNPTQAERINSHTRTVRSIFGRIAPRYDLMNRLMTFGQDQRWRREVIRRAAMTSGCWLLDLGAGTGDLSRETLRQAPDARVSAADFALEMMQVGQKRPGAVGIRWAAADALHLPFAAERFDALVSGYLLRNVADLDQALAEQLRVLKPGGRMVTLDTTRPVRNLFSPLIYIHMHWVIPLLGTLLTGQRDAYTYLPDTSENFLAAEALAERLRTAGFEEVGFHRFNFGTMAIHWGRKPFSD
jgi:demethylmenaquinone methyltransferase/2-methoxy-6-polyprenyl-1,4-benzoquinol methylase